MKKLIRILSLGLVGAGFLISSQGLSWAASSQALSIRVSINAVKSLSVNTTSYNFGAMSVDTSSVSTSAVVVTNDSGALLETYRVQGANALSQGGGTNWTLVSSTGTLDEYKLSAQFSNARPNNTSSDWSGDNLTTSPIVCTDSTLGNGTASESGADVMPTAGLNDRNLWFRITTPTSVSDTTERTATITLSVQ